MKSRHWHLLGKKAGKQQAPQDAQPEVWVSEKHVYNASEDSVEVNWELHLFPVQAADLFVSIYHSATSNGVSENHSWKLPAGQSSVKGMYPYQVDNMTVSELEFGILAGTGYDVPNTLARPNKVTVDVPQTVETAPQIWVSESYTYDELARRLDVTWALHIDPIQPAKVTVPIYHSSTLSGVREYWNWDIPANQSLASGVYQYPADNVKNVESLEFGIQAGSVYTVPNTPYRPERVEVLLSEAIPDQPIAPSAPTNGIVDDSANTFTFTKNPSFTTSEHEYSLNAGVSWATCLNTVIQVGNVSKAIGDIRVRVKSLSGNPAGNQLFNAQPFTETTTTGGNTPTTYSNPYPTSYSGPITITQGGTYAGNWESQDANVAAVTVRTSEEVIILNSNVKANGWGIDALVGSGQTLNLKVLNTRHFGGALSSKQRRFIEASNIKNLYVDHCYLEGSAGIKLAGLYYGNGTNTETVKILNIKALNIDGRTSSGSIHSQFFQCDGLRTNVVYRTDNAGQANEIKYYQGVPNMEIGWCHIVNEPGKCHVEDNINIYNSRGHTNNPIYIHDILVEGAYYYDWQGDRYTGSGMIADSPGTHRGLSTAYVNFKRCYVLKSNAAPFGIAGGNNITFEDCYAVGCGVINTADANRLGRTVGTAQTELKGYPSGVYADDNRYKMNSTYDNKFINLTEGVVGENSISLGYWRNDLSHPNGGLNAAWVSLINPTILADRITEATEQGYKQKFLNSVAAANVTIGVIESSTLVYSNSFDSEADISRGFTKETSTSYGITRVNNAARFELRNTDAATFNGVRAEIAFPSMSQSEQWFRFDFRLDSADNAIDPNPESIMQFRPVADAGETDGRGTLMALQVVNGNLRFYTAYATNVQNTGPENETFYELGPVPYNQVNSVLLHYKSAVDNSGIIELSLNETKVVHHGGPNRYNDSVLPFFKLGLYKWNWPATSVSTKRVLLIDNIQIYNSAPPIN